MATISTSGIAIQQIIRSEHLLRIISALNGEVPNDIIIAGTLSNGDESQASGRFTHAEGVGTLASGDNSHAEGSNTKTIGDSSHAEGYYTIAAGPYQHVQGQYNISSSVQSAFIIGNGTAEDKRSNLVFASGSEFQIIGSLSISGSVNINNILTLIPTNSLPILPPTGSIVVSGSGANCKPYFYNGTTWASLV
jgi:hypothetical protein